MMETQKYLRDDVISMRVPEPYDLDDFYKWENDSELWNISASTAPYSRQLLEDYIANYNPDIYSAGQLRLVITRCDNGAAIGTIDLYDFDLHNRRAGVGIMIDSRHRNQGYGHRALEIIATYCSSMLGMHQIYATIPVDNKASIKLFQKSGFKICGRYRSWLRIGTHYADVFALQRLFS